MADILPPEGDETAADQTDQDKPEENAAETNSSEGESMELSAGEDPSESDQSGREGDLTDTEADEDDLQVRDFADDLNEIYGGTFQAEFDHEPSDRFSVTAFIFGFILLSAVLFGGVIGIRYTAGQDMVLPVDRLYQLSQSLLGDTMKNLELNEVDIKLVENRLILKGRVDNVGQSAVVLPKFNLHAVSGGHETKDEIKDAAKEIVSTWPLLVKSEQLSPGGSAIVYQTIEDWPEKADRVTISLK